MNQDDLNADILKWETMSNDSKRTSDIDPNELDKYQVKNISFFGLFFVQKKAGKKNSFHYNKIFSQSQQIYFNLLEVFIYDVVFLWFFCFGKFGYSFVIFVDLFVKWKIMSFYTCNFNLYLHQLFVNYLIRVTEMI